MCVSVCLPVCPSHSLSWHISFRMYVCVNVCSQVSLPPPHSSLLEHRPVWRKKKHHSLLVTLRSPLITTHTTTTPSSHLHTHIITGKGGVGVYVSFPHVYHAGEGKAQFIWWCCCVFGGRGRGMKASPSRSITPLPLSSSTHTHIH